MKNFKNLSIVMSALLAAQGGISPAVFAMESNSFAEEQSNVEGGKQTEDSGNEEMKEQIQEEILRMIFFRQDLIGKLKQFLPNNMKEEDIPKSFRIPDFLELLEKNEIIKGIDNLQEVSEKENKGESELEEKSEDEWMSQQKKIKKIIEEDNLELLQKETENNMGIMIEDSFFEIENMRIPILHYCVMKKALKCFKFLILNGANPFKKFVSKSNCGYNEWDCMSVAICFGEWEMMKILEERGINKFSNPSVWGAAALTHRNNLLKLFVSNKDQIVNFQGCVDKAIFAAVKGNNLEGLKLLLSQGESANAKMNTMLYYAVEYNVDKVAEVLISKGADINKEHKWGKTLLRTAAENDADKIVELLVSKGADINETCWGGETQLHIAAENDALKVAELLISKGADINAKDKDGETPLHVAAKNDAKQVAEILISKGADINAKDKYGKTPLHIALENKLNQLAELLIIKGADVNAKDKNGETPLWIAVTHDADKIVELLVSKGADINARGKYGIVPLQDLAARKESWKVLELLISKGAVLQQSLLPIVLRNKLDNLAELLISKGADINQTYWGGETPLHIALRNKLDKLAELLISKGADINAKDSQGKTPLHVAIENRNDNLVDLLINKGANLNVKDKSGRTPFHVAAEIYWWEKFEFLISHGANRNEEDNNGMTPVDLAICKGLRKHNLLSSKQIAGNINEIRNLTRQQNL